MIEFFQNFFIFNRNAFFEIIYFISKNYWLLLGLCSIAYVFFAEQTASRQDEVQDERQIL